MIGRDPIIHVPDFREHEHAAGHPIGEDIGCLTCRALLVLSTEKAITELDWNHFWDGPVIDANDAGEVQRSWTELIQFGEELGLPYLQKKGDSAASNYTNAIQHIMPGVAHMRLEHWPEAVAELKKAINQVKLRPELLPLLKEYLQKALMEAETKAATTKAQEEHEERRHTSCHREIIYQQCMQLDKTEDIEQAWRKMDDMTTLAAAVLADYVKKVSDPETTLDQPQTERTPIQKRDIAILKKTRREYHLVARRLKELYDARIKLLKVEEEISTLDDAQRRVGKLYDLAPNMIQKDFQDKLQGDHIRKTYEPDKDEEDEKVEKVDDLKVGDMVMLAPGSDVLSVRHIGKKDTVVLNEEVLLKLVEINEEGVFVNFHNPDQDPDDSIMMGPIQSKYLRRAHMVWSGFGTFFNYKSLFPRRLSGSMLKIVTEVLNVPGYNFQKGNQGYGYYWIGDDTEALRSEHGVEFNIKEYLYRFNVMKKNSKWKAIDDENYKNVQRHIKKELDQLKKKVPEAEENIRKIVTEVQKLCCDGSGAEEQFKSARTNYDDLSAQLKTNNTDVVITKARLKKWRETGGFKRFNKTEISKVEAQLIVAEKARDATTALLAAALRALNHADDVVIEKNEKLDAKEERDKRKRAAAYEAREADIGPEPPSRGIARVINAARDWIGKGKAPETEEDEGAAVLSVAQQMKREEAQMVAQKKVADLQAKLKEMAI